MAIEYTPLLYYMAVSGRSAEGGRDVVTGRNRAQLVSDHPDLQA